MKTDSGKNTARLCLTLLTLALSGPAHALEFTGVSKDPAQDALVSMVDTAQQMTRSLDIITLNAATANLDVERASRQVAGTTPGTPEHAIANSDLRRAEEALMGSLFNDMDRLAPKMAAAEERSRKTVTTLLKNQQTYQGMVKAHLAGQQTPAVLAMVAYARTVKLKQETDRIQSVIVNAYLQREFNKVKEAYELLQGLTDIDVTPENLDEVLQELEVGSDLGLSAGPMDDLDRLLP